MTDSIPGISIWLTVKVATLILLGIYLVFSLVVTRQIKLINSTLSLGFEAPVTTLGYIHLAFAVLVFLAALIIL